MTAVPQALFVSRQHILESYYLEPEDLEAVPLADTTYLVLEETLELFKAIKVEHARLNMMRAGGSCLHDPVVKDADVYRKPLPFEAFYMVMALDEMEMEQTEGAYLLAGKLCDMIDIGEGDEDDEGRGDEMLSRQELRNAFAGMPQLHDHSIEEFLYLFQLNHEGQILSLIHI